tara:strand:+ start:306 stop:1256 length:951 start_codon:yes stop_codon:yes gene_type:complete
MNILYIDAPGRLNDSYMYQYYGDLYRELKQLCNVYVYDGPYVDIDLLTKQIDVEIDCIFFGLGYFARRDLQAYQKIPSLCNSKIFKAAYFHKAQIMCREKLQFCKMNNIDLFLDSQITYKAYAELVDAKPFRAWFSASPEIYRPRDIEKIYDIGFSGATHGAGKTVGPTEDIRDRIYDLLQSTSHKVFWKKHQKPEDRISSVEEYATRINQCKAWIATTGPYEDVGPRFFEVILSKTLLVCNKMPKQYEGVFQDQVNCVMFENDLSDFNEKLNHYLYNDSVRQAVIDNAYDTVINNYTSRHIALELLSKIKESKNE